jgi:hypothetical protein
MFHEKIRRWLKWERKGRKALAEGPSLKGQGWLL